MTRVSVVFFASLFNYHRPQEMVKVLRTTAGEIPLPEGVHVVRTRKHIYKITHLRSDAAIYVRRAVVSSHGRVVRPKVSARNGPGWRDIPHLCEMMMVGYEMARMSLNQALAQSLQVLFQNPDALKTKLPHYCTRLASRHKR